MTIHAKEVGPIDTNCYLITTNQSGSVIVDPGEDGDRLVQWIKELNTSLKAILITHGHWDHISGVASLVKEFPEVKIYMNPLEKPIVEWSKGQLDNKESARLLIEQSIPAHEGDKIQIDDLVFTVLTTPGHSQGGVVYLLEDNMFSGDTLFYKEIGRCDLVTGDYHVMLGTLKRLAKLKGDYKVYPGHMESTTLEFERKNNPYMLKVL